MEKPSNWWLWGGLIVALTAPGVPARGLTWIDPCTGHSTGATAIELPAAALGRVCSITGPRMITLACLDYHRRASDPVTPPPADELAGLAAACEATMPGETTGGTVLTPMKGN